VTVHRKAIVKLLDTFLTILEVWHFSEALTVCLTLRESVHQFYHNGFESTTRKRRVDEPSNNDDLVFDCRMPG
jgi:hypothetical protein